MAKRLHLASKEISSCLRLFCHRFRDLDFIKIGVRIWPSLLDRFDSFGELGVYFEDGAAGLNALAAINRSNLTHLELAANFSVGAELYDAFLAQWVSLPASSLRNLRSFVVMYSKGDSSFLQPIWRIPPQNLTRLSLELAGFDLLSIHVEFAKRFQFVRNVSLSINYLTVRQLIE
jgi:hypothetical protein